MIGMKLKTKWMWKEMNKKIRNIIVLMIGIGAIIGLYAWTSGTEKTATGQLVDVRIFWCLLDSFCRVCRCYCPHFLFSLVDELFHYDFPLFRVSSYEILVTGAKDFSCIVSLSSSITFRSIDSVGFCLVNKEPANCLLRFLGWNSWKTSRFFMNK